MFKEFMAQVGAQQDKLSCVWFNSESGALACFWVSDEDRRKYTSLKELREAYHPNRLVA